MTPRRCLLLITLTASVLLHAVDASQVLGVNSYRHVPGVGRYKLHTELLAYSEAEKACAAEDAHLALPTSKEAEEVMGELLQAAMVDYAFVGVNDINEEGKFVTVTGELYSEVGYSDWRWHAPDDWGSNEDCVGITWDMLLNDIPCLTPRAFLCEKNRPLPHDPY